MASDKPPNGESKDKKEQEEGGLGNLPPLSDFDSSGGFSSDTGLPPLSSFNSDKDKEKESVGGLPPLGDINIETPQPTGGAIKPPPAGFEVADFGTPSFDTAQQKPAKPRNGFQDMAADSDFSPETPEIGPGPEADIDTPMFDSAFGGAGARTFTPTFDTPAPTQAMETPIFGEPGKESPFDEGAFQAAAPFAAGGTPIPDFSPDSTMASKQPAPPPVAPPPAGKGKAKVAAAKGGGKSMVTVVVAAIVCLIVGILAGPFLSTKVAYIPNPLRSEIATLQAEKASMQATIDRLQPREGEGPKVTVEEINRLLDQQEKLAASIKDLTAQEEKARAELEKTASQLDQVRADLENKNEEFVKAQEAFEDLQNETAIVQARQLGLVAEVERLTAMVGTLEEANARSLSVKTGLLHAIERLETQIREGIPLTPEKFSRAKRIAAVEELKNQVSQAKWVTPELLSAYTDLYVRELEIGASTAYFFAKIPVTNKLGDVQQKWAECLMKGNWAVYYRTLDGKNIGSYENIAPAGMPPEYAFREQLPEMVRKEIDAEIVASRSPDFEEKVRMIAEKQEIIEGTASPLQRVFNSL